MTATVGYLMGFADGQQDQIAQAGDGEGESARAAYLWLADWLHWRSVQEIARGMTGDPMAAWSRARVLSEMSDLARAAAVMAVRESE